MLKYYPFTTIEGIDLFIQLTPYLEEPTLYMKVDGEMIQITVSSNEYELDLDEYFLHLNNLNEYIEYGCPILAELGETEPLGFYQMLKLKPEYVEIIDKCWDEHSEYLRAQRRKNS